MIRAAICEDVSATAKQLENDVKAIFSDMDKGVHVSCFSDGKELLQKIEEEGAFDLILMDIELKGMSGIEAARQIRERGDYKSVIIFLSYHTQYDRQMLKVNPFSFLEKPVIADELEKSLRRFLKYYYEKKEYITVKCGESYRRIFLEKVKFFESERRKIHIYCNNDENYHFFGKLEEVEQNLNSSKIKFVRVHKSYLANMEYVVCFRHDKVILDCGKEINISQKYRSHVKQILMEWMGR